MRVRTRRHQSKECAAEEMEGQSGNGVMSIRAHFEGGGLM